MYAIDNIHSININMKTSPRAMPWRKQPPSKYICMYKHGACILPSEEKIDASIQTNSGGDGGGGRGRRRGGGPGGREAAFTFAAETQI